MVVTFAAPVPLAPEQEVAAFDCGEPSLNDWLSSSALRNQSSGASRTYVSLGSDGVVAGYYALASSAIIHVEATGRLRRNMPEPIPVVVLGRLAVSTACKGQGLGRALFRDAALRTLAAADILGIRGLIVHALSVEARDFYLRLGLSPSPLHEMTLMVTLADLRASLPGEE